MSEPTLDDLLQAMMASQVSEDELAELLDIGMQTYNDAKSGLGTTLASSGNLLLTPLQFWFSR